MMSYPNYRLRKEDASAALRKTMYGGWPARRPASPDRSCQPARQRPMPHLFKNQLERIWMFGFVLNFGTVLRRVEIERGCVW